MHHDLISENKPVQAKQVRTTHVAAPTHGHFLSKLAGAWLAMDSRVRAVLGNTTASRGTLLI
eukprot:3992730-Lingulodinium_polyedra.AAC.1